jgi:ABC-type sugar transport system ATPase subunit
MSGRRDETYVRRAAADEQAGEHVPARSTRLQARDVVLAAGRQPFSLTVSDGEILGLAGLEGHGQVAFLESIAGLRKELSGSIEVAEGTGFARVRGLTDGFRKGIAYVPRDRKNEGIFAPLSVLDNVSLPSLNAYSRFGVLRWRRLVDDMVGHLETVRLRGGTIATTISKLSGGNQQKVLLARALAVSPKLLLLNDPTRGVDLGVKAEIYRLLESLAGEGMAIVLLSTEVEELCRLCPRVAVFHELTCTSVLEGEITPELVVGAMFGEGSE